ncbi:MAG: FAD-binding oxidoreductase [Sneathiellaceae bacterium]
MTARTRKFWGWGFEGEGLDAAEHDRLMAAMTERYGTLSDPLPVPRLEDISLRRPRVQAPAALSGIISDSDADRIRHSYGQSFPDIARAFLRQFPEPPDLVAWPETADQVRQLVDWAGGARVAVIPFGGGTSVCGGVEPDVGPAYAGTLTVDMTRMNKVLEVDRASRAALIQAGARGPEFDAELKKSGLTLRHFPQSYQMATLGGMIVTRSGGHFATLYTHIDEFVESVALVSPTGAMQTRRLPGAGAGPDPNRWVSGSEGVLGIVTEAWMRLQDVPKFRAGATVRFGSFYQAAKAVRAIVQSGLHPANCRLLDAEEAFFNGAGDGSHAVLVLGFENADHPQEARLERALEIAADLGGTADRPEGAAPQRAGAAEAWRTAFIRMPFWREVQIAHGIMFDTFETACTWSEFEEFHTRVSREVKAAIRDATGQDGTLTCRFTHVYPDGPAPYFSYTCNPGTARMLEVWAQIKRAANAAVVRHGGTVTHHHAVGRDHRFGGYDVERPALFATALSGAKSALDPNGVMNPGVLIDPHGAQHRPGGILQSV